MLKFNEVEIMVLKEVINFFYANHAINAVSDYDYETLLKVKEKLDEFTK